MWDIKCVASALCFIGSNALFFVHGFFMTRSHNSSNSSSSSSSSFSFSQWKELDPAYIEERWELRRENRVLVMIAALMGTLAWFFLIAPVIQAAWVLSKGGRRQVGSHSLLAALVICGGMSEFLSRLMTVGMSNTAGWLAHDFNLSDWTEEGGDGTGWRVLEMIHTVTMGLVLWIDAFEALALFGIVTVLYYSVITEPVNRNASLHSSALSDSAFQNDGDDSGAVEGEFANGVITDASETSLSSSPPPAAAFAAVPATQSSTTMTTHTFSKSFIRYGVFVGLIALLDFLADVLRFMNWRVFGTMGMALNILLGCVLLPIWLLCLGRQLPMATERFERAERRRSVLLDRVVASVSSSKEEAVGLMNKGGELEMS